MSDLLDGKALHWLAWDEAGVVTAAMATMLRDILSDRPVRLQLQIAATPEGLAKASSRQPCGLASWCLADEVHLPAVCKAIISLCQKYPKPICVCFVDQPRADSIAILLEAGAQIVVSQLPSLQRSMPQILAAAPLSTYGYHPLTSGLVERLPWGM